MSPGKREPPIPQKTMLEQFLYREGKSVFKTLSKESDTWRDSPLIESKSAAPPKEANNC